MHQIKLNITLFIVFLGLGLFSQNGNSIQFSSAPFSMQPKISDHFLWGSTIYGKLVMEKPLKNYAKKLDNYDMMNIADKNKYTSALIFMVCPKSEDIKDRTYQLIPLVVSQQDLDSKTVVFDVMPSEEDASSLFITGFYSELAKSKLIKYDASEGTSSGEKIEFDIYLFEKDLGYSEQDPATDGRVAIASQSFIHLGKLTIDYSSVSDVRQVMEWHDRSRTIKENIADKYKNN